MYLYMFTVYCILTHCTLVTLLYRFAAVFLPLLPCRLKIHLLTASNMLSSFLQVWLGWHAHAEVHSVGPAAQARRSLGRSPALGRCAHAPLRPSRPRYAAATERRRWYHWWPNQIKTTKGQSVIACPAKTWIKNDWIVHFLLYFC